MGLVGAYLSGEYVRGYVTLEEVGEWVRLEDLVIELWTHPGSSDWSVIARCDDKTICQRVPEEVGAGLYNLFIDRWKRLEEFVPRTLDGAGTYVMHVGMVSADGTRTEATELFRHCREDTEVHCVLLHGRALDIEVIRRAVEMCTEHKPAEVFTDW